MKCKTKKNHQSLGHFIKHKAVFLKSERVANLAKQRIYDFLKKSFSLDKSQIDFDLYFTNMLGYQFSTQAKNVSQIFLYMKLYKL